MCILIIRFSQSKQKCNTGKQALVKTSTHHSLLVYVLTICLFCYLLRVSVVSSQYHCSRCQERLVIKLTSCCVQWDASYTLLTHSTTNEKVALLNRVNVAGSRCSHYSGCAIQVTWTCQSVSTQTHTRTHVRIIIGSVGRFIAVFDRATSDICIHHRSASDAPTEMKLSVLDSIETHGIRLAHGTETKN